MRSAGRRKVAKRTHGAHFIVNTSSNGQGPKLNPHPTTQGVEDLCNPPGRGLGPKFNTDTGYPVRGRVHVDAPARKHEWLRRWSSRRHVLAPRTPSASATAPTRSSAPASPAGPTEVSLERPPPPAPRGRCGGGVGSGQRGRRARHRRQAAGIGEQAADLLGQPRAR